jgi:NAD+ kinase
MARTCPVERPALKTIGLFGKYGDQGVGPIVGSLCEFLRDRGLGVVLEDATARLLRDPKAEAQPVHEIGRHIDLAIVVGGDGTMLNVARSLAPYDVPLIGVNLGRLGFLTDIPSDSMFEGLQRVLDGDYQTERRLLLCADVLRDGKLLHNHNALNDVVINKGQVARLIEFETYVDDEFVTSTRADGIIVATPTGSTAYALSAGGPILHPTLPAFIMVPICPHTLSYRPIAVSSDSHIEIVMTHTGNQTAHVTFDGQTNFGLQDGDRVSVRRTETPVTLLRPSHRNHYDVLRTKLRWGEKF